MQGPEGEEGHQQGEGAAVEVHLQGVEVGEAGHLLEGVVVDRLWFYHWVGEVVELPLREVYIWLSC